MHVIVHEEMLTYLGTSSGAAWFQMRATDPSDPRLVDALAAARLAVAEIRHPEEPSEPFPNFVSEVEVLDAGPGFWVDIKDGDTFPLCVEEMLNAAADAIRRVLEGEDGDQVVLAWPDAPSSAFPTTSTRADEGVAASRLAQFVIDATKFASRNGLGDQVARPAAGVPTAVLTGPISDGQKRVIVEWYLAEIVPTILTAAGLSTAPQELVVAVEDGRDATRQLLSVLARAHVAVIERRLEVARGVWQQGPEPWAFEGTYASGRSIRIMGLIDPGVSGGGPLFTSRYLRAYKPQLEEGRADLTEAVWNCALETTNCQLWREAWWTAHQAAKLPSEVVELAHEQLGDRGGRWSNALIVAMQAIIPSHPTDGEVLWRVLAERLRSYDFDLDRFRSTLEAQGEAGRRCVSIALGSILGALPTLNRRTRAVYLAGEGDEICEVGLQAIALAAGAEFLVDHDTDGAVAAASAALSHVYATMSPHIIGLCEHLAG